MPAIRLGGDEQPWRRARAPGPTARLRSRPVEIGGIETRAVSAAGEGAADGAPARLARQRRHLARGARPARGRRAPGDRLRPARVRHRAGARPGLGARPAGRLHRRRGRVGGRGLGSRGGRRRQLARRLGRPAAGPGSRPAAGRDRPDRPGGRADGAGVLHPRPDPGGLADHRPAGAGAAGGSPLGRRRPLPPARLRRPRRGRPGGRRPLHPLSRRPARDPRADRVREAPAPRARRPVRRRRDRGPGERDLGRARPALPGAGAEQLAERLPAAEIAVLPGVGHTPQVEAPDVVVEAIAALAAGAAEAS